MRLDNSDIRKLGYKGVIGFVFAAVVLAFIYNLLTGFNVVVGFLAMLIAVFGSYLIFVSFEKKAVPPRLEGGEAIILETVDPGYVVFPAKRGRFLGKRNKSHQLNLYLTNKRIIGKDADVVLDIGINSIKGVGVEKRFFKEYMRVSYLEDNKEKDVLLVTGDKALWLQKLRGLGVEAVS